MAKWQVDTPSGQSYVVEADTWEAADAAVTNAPNAFAGGFDASQDNSATATGMESSLNEADKVGRGYHMFNSALLGGYDEVIGLVEGGMEFVKGGDFNDGYARGTSNVRDAISRYEQRHPTESMALGVAASLPTAMIPGGAAVKGTNLLTKAGRGTVAGGAYGTTQGYLSGEGGMGNRGKSAAIGGAVGAVIGGAVAPVAAGIGRIAGNRAGRAQTAPGETVGKEAGTFFEAAEQSGVAIKDRPLKRLALIRGRMNGVGSGTLSRTMPRLRPKLHPNTIEALDILDEAARAPTLTFADLMTTRQLLRDAANAAYKADPRGKDYHYADEVLDRFDEWRKGLNGNDVYPGAVSPHEANRMLDEANRLWTVKKKTDIINDIVFRAGGGDDLDEAVLRRGIKALTTNPKRMAAFSKEEQADLRMVANGGNWRKLLSAVNKAMPNTGLASMGSVIVGDPTIMGMSAIKGAAGKGVNVSTNRAMDKARTTIDPNWQRPYDPTVAASREDYANRLLGAAGQTGGGQVLDLGNVLDRGTPARMIPAR